MAQDAEVGMKCITYMIFTTNFMFSMIGFLLISVGSTIISIYNDFEIFMEDHFFSPAALLIAIGVIIFLVSIFGCVGAAKKSTCLINVFGLLLSCILILEISAAIAGYAMRDDVAMYVEESMSEAVDDYFDDDVAQSSWDFMQESLDCCGIHGTNTWTEYGNGTLPSSCYEDNEHTEVRNDGCVDKLAYIVEDCATLIGTGAICVAVVQLLGVVFAFMLAKSIRRLKTELAMQRHENQLFYAQLARGQTNEKPTPVTYAAPEVSNY